jgi:hypothetical protein
VSGLALESTKGRDSGYGLWLHAVREALRSINMSIEDWQKLWPLDLRAEYEQGTRPNDAALKATRFSWHQQNKSMRKECHNWPGC